MTILDMRDLENVKKMQRLIDLSLSTKKFFLSMLSKKAKNKKFLCQNTYLSIQHKVLINYILKNLTNKIGKMVVKELKQIKK